ncbi:MAG: M48 family metalloprotease [Anaerolineae bacterium]
MLRKLIWLIALALPLLALLALAPPTLAQGPPPQPGRDMIAEQQILDRLALVNPDAVPAFKAATEAFDRGDLATAKTGYELALALAPDFPDTERRLSQVERESGNADAALQHAQRAYDKDHSAWNELAMAQAFLAQKDETQHAKALPYARSAAGKEPNDLSIQWALFRAAGAGNDAATVRAAADRMVSIEPNNPVGHYAKALAALVDGQSATATAELDRAEALGLPPEVLAPMRAELDRGPLGIRMSWYRLAADAVVLWLLVGAALFIAGVVLSRMALSAINRYETKGEFDVGPAERGIRSVYKWVISVASVYFYVSIPFLILTVLAVYGGIAYVILRIGFIPVYFMLALVVGAITSIIAVVRSLFVRIRDTEPGRSLTHAEAPRLWQVVEDVGKHVDSRPVDVIYLTPGAEIAVMERGNLWRKMRGTARRCLILGLAALPGMPLPQFQAILAHEYGHFSNKDTSGGTLANQVQVSLMRLAEGLARRGLARWYNPAWLFVNVYFGLFMRATRGASRLQEVLADRYAALAYGADNLIAGLLFTVRRGLNFDWEADYQIRLALQTQRDLANLYAVSEPTVNDAQKEISAAYEVVVNRETGLYDTHPSLKDRIALLEKLPQMPAEAGQVSDVLELLPNYDALAQEMTQTVEQRIMMAELRKLKREA